eukprot:4580740-Pyramimonas_sp.AAC.1
MDKLRAIDPAYAKACDEGLEWCVIRWQVEEALPELPTEAFNSGHGTERLQTAAQSLMQIHASGMRNFKSKQDYAWESAIKTMESSKPYLAGKARDLCDFVLKWSGGDDGILLKDLDRWTKTLRFRKEVTNTTFRALASLDFASGPEFAIAMLKACLVSPDQYSSGA